MRCPLAMLSRWLQLNIDVSSCAALTTLQACGVGVVREPVQTPTVKIFPSLGPLGGTTVGMGMSLRKYFDLSITIGHWPSINSSSPHRQRWRRLELLLRK